MNQQPATPSNHPYLKIWIIFFTLSSVAAYAIRFTPALILIGLSRLGWLLPHAGFIAMTASFLISAFVSFFIFRWSTKKFLVSA